jgi:hypothetical protein
MNEGNMHKLCYLFKEGRTDVNIEAGSGCPSVFTEDLKDRFDAYVRENR